MRRRQYEFALSKVMHIRPWEIDLMTVEEFDRACASIDAYLEAQRNHGEE